MKRKLWKLQIINSPSCRSKSMRFSFLQGTQKKIYWRMSSVLFLIMRTVKLQKCEIFPSFIVLKSHLCSFSVPDLTSWYQTSLVHLVVDIKASKKHLWTEWDLKLWQRRLSANDWFKFLLLCKVLLQFYCMASGSFLSLLNNFSSFLELLLCCIYFCMCYVIVQHFASTRCFLMF